MKQAFILYNDYYDKLRRLSNEQLGMLFRAILAAQNGEKPELDDIAAEMAYEFISVDIERHKAAYEERCRINAENGKRGGRPPKPKKATETEKTDRFQENQSQPVASEKSRYDKIGYDKDKNNIYTDIISYLNAKAGKDFKSTTDATRRLIDARLHEGYKTDDFKRVIDVKTAEWKNTDNDQYLRPQTLFGTKFEAYLNQRPAKPARRAQAYDERDYAPGELEKLVADPLAELIAQEELL